MDKTLYPSQGSEIFMTNLTSYINKSQVQTKLYYFDINPQNNKLKLRPS